MLSVACTHDIIPTRSLSSILAFETTHAHITPNGTACILPFQNICSRATVRVVDFFPHDLVDFAVRHKTSEFDALSDNENGDDSENGNEFSSMPSSYNSGLESSSNVKSKWEWRFCLLLEDANPSMEKIKDRMKVVVANDDAVFLLKLDAEKYVVIRELLHAASIFTSYFSSALLELLLIEPLFRNTPFRWLIPISPSSSLRTAPVALSQLREKLFILWGDLEERKSCARALKDRNVNQAICKTTAEDGKIGMTQSLPRTIPFQCCIKEYGVKVHGGWKRRFRMFGSTIL